MLVELNAYAQWSLGCNDPEHVTLNHTHTCTLDTLPSDVCVYTPYAVTSCSSIWRGFGFVLIEKKLPNLRKNCFTSTRIITEHAESLRVSVAVWTTMKVLHKAKITFQIYVSQKYALRINGENVQAALDRKGMPCA